MNPDKRSFKYIFFNNLLFWKFLFCCNYVIKITRALKLSCNVADRQTDQEVHDDDRNLNKYNRKFLHFCLNNKLKTNIASSNN